MNELIPSSNPRRPHRTDNWWLPALATLLLHGGAAWMLYQSWSPEAPTSAPQTVMITQLVTLPSPVPEPLPTPEPVTEPEPVVQTEPPVPIEPQPDQADIARKRLEEREHQQRLAEQRRQQEHERQRREQQAQAEQRQRELAEQHVREQQRLAAEAQAQALAEAEAARHAAEAEAIAQYQPISKKPPAYPRRALDRGLEGDCTVSYTVTPDGRVTDPQVVDGACDNPLFERPSLAAAKSFRYQPRTVNGQRVAVQDVRNTFRYRIQ